MTPNEYQKLAERTSSTAKDARVQRLLHAGLGFCTEAGEFMDPIKRAIFYHKRIDKAIMVNLGEELGDILWYVAEGCNALGINMEDVMAANIAKLKVRYPDKFTEEKAVNRSLGEELKAILAESSPFPREDYSKTDI